MSMTFIRRSTSASVSMGVARCVLMGDGEAWRLVVRQHGTVAMDVATDESTALRMGRLWRQDDDIGS